MVEKATFAKQHESGGWEDEFGMIGPFKQGDGPRTNPMPGHPTGPDLGTALPDIVALAHDGSTIDIHADRAGRPAAVVFYRSAVW